MRRGSRSASGAAASAALSCAALLALALACSPEPSPESAGPEPDEAETAARVGEEVITVEEVDERIKEKLLRRETDRGDPFKLHELREEALAELVNRRVLEEEAEREGRSPEELLRERIQGEVAVPDEEVRAFYERNREQLSGSFEEAAPRIRQRLRRQARAEAVQRYLETLRERHGAEMELEAPSFDLAARGAQRGPDDAPVTIVAFGDYECSHCRRAQGVLEELLERYPERVRLVYRHFPLEPMHPRARAAAEAAVCAEGQDRFWPLHERLFAAEDLGREALLDHAEAAGLDLEPFRECLEGEDATRRVEQDLQAARDAGVSAIPTFFVNGTPLRGAKSLDRFVELVEQELATSDPAPGEPGRG